MTVKQVNNDVNNVTINVSEITEGDRQTEIWINEFILGADKGDWYTLQAAEEAGYIIKFETELDENNGNIQIWFHDAYAEEYKVWYFRIWNVNLPGGERKYAEIPTVLSLAYENGDPKMPEKDIDITKYDMQQINLFGMWLDSYLGNAEGRYYPLDDVDDHAPMFADYIVSPAINILNAAFEQCATKETLPSDLYSYINNDCLSPIVNDCKSGTPVYAAYFNSIVLALQNFKLSVTV